VKSQAALTNLQGALDKYAGWILHHEPNTWLNFGQSDIELVVNGSWDVYYVTDDLDLTTEADGYSVESFFPYDWKPLTTEEIKHSLDMLVWSRDDLLKSVQGLSEEKLNQKYTGERWSINGVLNHVGGAELWYMDRLGLAFPKTNLPEDPLTRLEKVRNHFNKVLFKMDGIKQVVGVDGEIWSPRKMLRRALWHERDHVDHIHKLVEMSGKLVEDI